MYFICFPLGLSDGMCHILSSPLHLSFHPSILLFLLSWLTTSHSSPSLPSLPLPCSLLPFPSHIIYYSCYVTEAAQLREGKMMNDILQHLICTAL